MTPGGLLWFVAAIISVGIAGLWCGNDERRLKRLAAIYAGYMAIGIAILALRGDFLRYASDSEDYDAAADVMR